MLTAAGRAITAFDRVASNGVLHTLEEVLLPPVGDLLDVVHRQDDLSTFASALDIAGNITAFFRGREHTAVYTKIAPKLF